jgi:hypothetical protein
MRAEWLTHELIIQRQSYRIPFRKIVANDIGEEPGRIGGPRWTVSFLHLAGEQAI